MPWLGSRSGAVPAEEVFLQLHEAIEQRSLQIIERWRGRAARLVAGESMPINELTDSLPLFLLTLAAVLRRTHEAGEPAADAPTTLVSAAHGSERLHLGFAPHEVVREYALLFDCVLEEAREAGVKPTDASHRALTQTFFAAIGSSIAAYVRERDLSLQGQASEHLGFLAHELRNPLSAATMALTLAAREEAVKQGRLGRLFEAVRRGVARTIEQLDHALTQARLQAHGALKPEPLEAALVLEEAREDALALAESAEVTVRIEAEPITVLADPRLLRSALTNLVHNAVKFTRRGGEVVLRARPVDARVRFEVEDQCGGLPAGAAEKIFDPFVQAGSNRRGFGLGLAIARQAVEAHGGNLSLHDLHGKGCVFLLELPATPKSA